MHFLNYGVFLKMSLLLSFDTRVASPSRQPPPPSPLPYFSLKIEEGEGLIPPPWRRINNGRLRRERGGMMGKRDVEMGGEESEGAGDETECGTNVAK